MAPPHVLNQYFENMDLHKKFWFLEDLIGDVDRWPFYIVQCFVERKPLRNWSRFVCTLFCYVNHVPCHILVSYLKVSSNKCSTYYSTCYKFLNVPDVNLTITLQLYVNTFPTKYLNISLVFRLSGSSVVGMLTTLFPTISHGWRIPVSLTITTPST